MNQTGFTPALGHSFLTPLYDLALRVATREQVWRRLLLEQLAPADGEAILDVGCGTGSFAVLVKLAAPGSRVVGLDPDPAVLAMAREKAARAKVEIEWQQGFAGDAGQFRGQFNKSVSSLVFHQVPVAEKETGLRAMFEAVGTGGSVHIADYARQPDRLMRAAFRVVQKLDGYENTQANVDGAVERILASQQGIARVSPSKVVRTPTGAISLFNVTGDQLRADCS